MTTSSSDEPVDDLDDPAPEVPPEPSKATGATASERASAQVAAELSGPRGPDGLTQG
jgi:hypothetical protein